MSSNDTREACRPHFFMDEVENKALSEKEGRPIFESKEMVELKMPGDKHWSWVGFVDEPGMRIKERFPDAYAAFKRGEQRATIGTPLEQWPPLTRARVAELKASNILTVEEFSMVPDNMLPKLGMNSRAEREQAKAWLSAAKDGAATSAMAARMAQLEEALARLQGAAPVVAPVEAPKEKSLEDCTDQEIKEYIKRETGEAPRGNISRETLLKRAAEIAQAA